jgi:hypothetical protein
MPTPTRPNPSRPEAVVRERPILFSAPMIRALLDGRKTQTRRIYSPAKGFPSDDGETTPNPSEGSTWTDYGPCPYGVVGDRLWVREAWRLPKDLDAFNGTEVAEKCAAAHYQSPWAPVIYEADGRYVNWEEWDCKDPGRYRHARFMPRWASRITLEITESRVERLHDITESDAEAEGVEMGYQHPGFAAESFALRPIGYRPMFRRLWNEINGDGAWERNDLLRCLTFRRFYGASHAK